MMVFLANSRLLEMIERYSIHEFQPIRIRFTYGIFIDIEMTRFLEDPNDFLKVTYRTTLKDTQPNDFGARVINSVLSYKFSYF